MRWLEARARELRERSERGISAVVIAASIVGIVGMAAFVIDVGKLFEERRDLQNGADAAALSLARDCAEDHPRCSDTGVGQSYLESLAGQNSNDGQSRVLTPDIDIDVANRQVTVTVRSRDASDGSDDVDFSFAPVLGFEGSEVAATASAAWSAPSGASSIPVTISACEWGNATGGLANPTFPTAEVLLKFHLANSSEECAAGPGHDVDDEGSVNEGGFGFLDASDCETEIVFVDTNNDGDPDDIWIKEKNGASTPGSVGCDVDDVLGSKILIPIFDDVDSCDVVNAGPPGQSCYHIFGFGAFEITEMNFGGQWKTSPTLDCNGSDPGNGGDCLKGFFTELVANEDLSEWEGNLPDLGVYVIGLQPIP